MNSGHVVYIVQRHAWCANCTWQFRGPIDETEDAAQYHVYLSRGAMRPGWGVAKPNPRSRRKFGTGKRVA